MLRRIWQWLKGLFQSLFGGATPRRSRPSDKSSLSSLGNGGTGEASAASKPLDDADYEFLFLQLLEGVAHSWQQDRVVRWFDELKGRITPEQWAAWLRRFGIRVLTSPAPNQELGMRLVLLGDMTLSAPSLEEIGAVTYDIGRELLNREPTGVVWEYDGPDAEPGSTAPPVTSPLLDGEQMQEEEEVQPEMITLDELFVRLQQDPNLLQAIAQQLGIETNDPEVIVQEIIDQFNASNPAATDEA
jgi:hypothetical protein